MAKKAVIELNKTLPDNIYPDVEDKLDGIDRVYIYYRLDGNLYLYDTKTKHEFNLFNLPEG